MAYIYTWYLNENLNKIILYISLDRIKLKILWLNAKTFKKIAFNG